MRHENNLISVCVATYKREEQLEKLLKSLFNQNMPSDMFLEIIITDNDKNQSARSILSKFNPSGIVRLKYFCQPVKNISLTRNVSLNNAEGQFICFIDDDETADNNWINSLYNAITKYRADVVFGYVEAVFEENIPTYLKNREYYFSQFDVTGSKAKYYYTTNAMVKANSIKINNLEFDPAYGLTGGEDVHFFERLEMKGSKLIICKEAVTFEFIPLQRGNDKYLYNRAFRGGQSFARRKIELSPEGFLKIRIFFSAIVQLMFYSTLVLIMFFSDGKRTICYIKIGSSMGKIMSVFNRFKKLY